MFGLLVSMIFAMALSSCSAKRTHIKNEFLLKVGKFPSKLCKHDNFFVGKAHGRYVRVDCSRTKSDLLKWEDRCSKDLNQSECRSLAKYYNRFGFSEKSEKYGTMISNISDGGKERIEGKCLTMDPDSADLMACKYLTLHSTDKSTILAAFDRGCLLLDGGFCLSQFILLKQLGQKESAIFSYEKASDLLRQECEAGEGRSCAALEYGSEKCYPTSKTCKASKLFVMHVKNRNRQLVAAAKRHAEELRLKRAALSAQRTGNIINAISGINSHLQGEQQLQLSQQQIGIQRQQLRQQEIQNTQPSYTRCTYNSFIGVTECNHHK